MQLLLLAFEGALLGWLASIQLGDRPRRLADMAVGSIGALIGGSVIFFAMQPHLTDGYQSITAAHFAIGSAGALIAVFIFHADMSRRKRG